MRQFKWIEWNLQKIDARGLSAEEVEIGVGSVFPISTGQIKMIRHRFFSAPDGRHVAVGSSKGAIFLLRLDAAERRP